MFFNKFFWLKGTPSECDTERMAKRGLDDIERMVKRANKETSSSSGVQWSRAVYADRLSADSVTVSVTEESIQIVFCVFAC